MRVLGIETSCDETSAAVIVDGAVKSNVVASQMDLHSRFGGVVPELASRRHVEVIDEVLERSLSDAGVDISRIDAIGVTAGPGLPGALMVGLAFAQALAWSVRIPLYAINHLEGHLLAAKVEYPDLDFPFLGLLVSGGHTELVHARGLGRYEILGETLDDAAGEAFDKVGTLLGLQYPAGRAIEDLARSGDPTRFSFPRPMSKKPGLDFSFSGLKTAVAVALRGYSSGEIKLLRPDMAAGFQEAALEAVVAKFEAALRLVQPDSAVVCGGVAANTILREKIREVSGTTPVFFPSASLCTDNAAMIAFAAYERVRLGLPASGVSLEPVPDWRLDEGVERHEGPVN